MEAVNQFGAIGWLGVLKTVFLILCFYCTLCYFQYLKEGDERKIKQSRLAAVTCLAIALLVPVIYNFYLFNHMMQ